MSQIYDFEVAYNTGEVRRFAAKDTDEAQRLATIARPPMAVQWKLFGISYIATGNLQLTMVPEPA